MEQRFEQFSSDKEGIKSIGEEHPGEYLLVIQLID
jgi:hypothetical protein